MIDQEYVDIAISGAIRDLRDEVAREIKLLREDLDRELRTIRREISATFETLQGDQREAS
jgi:hypothetical protein